jgi:mannose-6-phosphate isomerase-like protein (cupin superfamily)
MPVFRPTDATTFEMHGSSFSSYVAPSRGSNQLCAWRLDVPAETEGVTHRPNRDEIVLVLRGRLHVTLDGDEFDAGVGDVILVPADSMFRVDSHESGATAWVATTPGLEAIMADGSRICPPWAQ